MPLLAAQIAAMAFLRQAPTLHLPSLFSDNMVLQRDQPIPFYGTAASGTHIDITLNGHHAFTNAKSDGTWELKLRPMSAGGPYTATISGDGTVTLHNVMIGEVWVCSGQSNMEMTVAQANESDIAQANADPAIRMFTVQRLSSENPAPDVTGTWQTATSDTVLGFSAVGYWYAAELHKVLGVPIGLIHSSWGGTPAEAWINRRSLRNSATFAPLVDAYLSGLKDFPERKAAFDKAFAEWKESVYHTDTGNEGFGMGYADPQRDTASWRECQLPNLLQVTEGREMNGAVWYRRVITLPLSFDAKSLRIGLGPISDYDDTYFNGIKVGSVDDKMQYPYAIDRVYPIPPALAHAGPNVIAIRVFNRYGHGGFTGGAAKFKIWRADGMDDPVSIAGTWISKVERYIPPATQEVVASQPQPPYGPGHPWAPGGLFNGMIDPVIPYKIRGVIWYQGEANADRAFAYRELFPLLISDWRAHWGEGDFPFYFVQLPNYTARLDQPGESNWAELREAQAMALKLPNTGMATTIDLGDANDIHPKNKHEVGRRLALIALNHTYGGHNIWSGPVVKRVTYDGAEAKIEFDETIAGLKSADGSAIAGFTLAGEDRKFYWGTARIVRDSVIVTCPYVAHPVAVRYAWANNPYVNLVNSEGLPCVPFRTDDWPGITVANSVASK
jgi:sialate O-acetylesterase